MTIPSSRYVDIESQVVGGSVISNRQFILRLYTTNPLVPTGSNVDFTSLTAVGSYFGTSSAEYARAAKYLTWISKNFTKPAQISFGSYVPTAVPPKIFGATFSTSLSAFQAVTNGSIGLTLGAITHQVTAIDFSAAVSLADVAEALEDAIQAADVSTQWSSATVTYDSVKKAFNFVGGDAVDAVISTAPGGTGTNLQGLVGWQVNQGAIYSNGSAVQTITQTLTQSVDVSNNFGSFAFIPYLTSDQAVEAATWNSTQDPNVQFIFSIAPIASDLLDYQTALAGIAGTNITKASPSSADFADQYVPQVLAATDYTRENSVQNYMYQQFPGDTASVTTAAEADQLDAINVNYLGQTQQAGQPLNFYQTGVLQGGISDPTDVNAYANEMWFKDAVAVDLLRLLLSVSRVPANRLGVIQCLGIVQGDINQALFNGMISVDKPLTVDQIAAITAISNDENAWYQVQNTGYWITGSVDPVNKKFSYTLIYSKDDTVNTINGFHYLV